MHVILLADRTDPRLAQLTGGGPTCLLPFDSQSLLERHLRNLAAAGVHRVTVVVGVEAMQIEQALGAIVPDAAPDMTIDTIQNPAFREGSAASVVAARAAVAQDDETLLIDADLLYDAQLLAAFVGAENQGQDLLAIDRGGDDRAAGAVRIALASGRVVAFGPGQPTDKSHDTVGESPGIRRLSAETARRLLVACEAQHAADLDASLEVSLCHVIQDPHVRFDVREVTGLPWIAIKTPADVDRASDDVMPRLR